MQMATPAQQLWAMLDDMADSDPEGYQAFIRQQLQEGADFCAPPEPQYCLRTHILGPEERVLYINVCGWKRVPRPDSPAHAVPLCGGRLEMVSEGPETYYVLDVAFNPEVLRGEQEGDRRAWSARLAVDFVQQQHDLQVSQGYTVAKTHLMGSERSLHERLASSRRAVAPDLVPTDASFLQQISSLRSRADDPPVVLAPFEQPGPQTPPLIQDDILLQVEDLYRLHLELPAAVREEETTAVFNRKRETLSVSLPLL
ncbi:PIH1 domain-containing protein 2 isoform X2 [Brienomyrus brachyistius]|uniref:PIH1 domain-containing protein 2 isoform X2 n=1 Tax=Brienomyrus brachyistius TaxID=42636 RepID=UPI0020B24C13|nr:PIH1 domain-containing protein 2 isoform X2 [Brienomyrus brachyistius]